MYGLAFELAPPPAAASVPRADVACFVGFVARSGEAVPAAIAEAIHSGGYLTGLAPADAAARLAALDDVPVPIDTWDTFDRLFAWRERPLPDGGGVCDAALGVAVRSFFANGGRKCWVVRVGNPAQLASVPADTAPRRAWVNAHLARLLPGYPDVLRADVSDRAGWRGVAHLHGLAEPALLLLPDLPDLCAAPPARTLAPLRAVPRQPEFVPCAPAVAAPPARGLRWLAAPSCDEEGYACWARAVSMAGRFLAAARPDCQFLATLPIPHADSGADHDVVAALVRRALAAGTTPPLADPQGTGGFGPGRYNVASAFVQLAYPWLAVGDELRLPQGLLPPEGVLAGMVADAALTQGAWRTVAGKVVMRANGVFPPLPAHALDAATGAELTRESWPQRLSLFAPGPYGVRLLSDVTASVAPPHRPAAGGRLIGLVMRHARELGDTHVFESSGEVLWARVRQSLTDLLTRFWQAGALAGASPAEAFDVRCDRSTMTQADLDAGRCIVRVAVAPQGAVERIVVQLALAEDASAFVDSLPDSMTL